MQSHEGNSLLDAETTYDCTTTPSSNIAADEILNGTNSLRYFFYHLFHSPKKLYSNAHYVGYVEENESIEAIMKKFEELARMEEEFKKTSNTNTNTNGEGGSNGTINDTSSPLADGELVLGVEKVQTNDGHQGFTDEQLQEVFKRTSGFTVRSMMRDTPEDIYEEDVWQANIADEDYLYDFEEEEYVALSFFFLAHEWNKDTAWKLTPLFFLFIK